MHSPLVEKATTVNRTRLASIISPIIMLEEKNQHRLAEFSYIKFATGPSVAVAML